jgi:hypothetical protein
MIECSDCLFKSEWKVAPPGYKHYEIKKCLGARYFAFGQFIKMTLVRE